jgi:PAT family beta-lactamase induction signal transducer AmpG
MSERLRLSDVLGNRRVAAALTLGFASGLPFNLAQGTLQAWLASVGLDLKTIGWLTLVGIPYTFKFLWAPFLDRFVPPFFGRRRGWIVLFQAAIAVVIALIGLQAPNDTIYIIALLAVLLSFLSASQDVVIDAYRTDTLRPVERGMGSTAVQLGWRLAALISGAAALVLSQYIGWRDTYLLMAVLMAATLVLTVRAPEPERAVVPPSSLRAAMMEPLRELLLRPGAIAILILVVLYKVGDAAALSLSTAFLIKGVGFTAAEVGAIAKTTMIVSILLGTAIGGLAYARLGLFRSLLIFGILQALTNLLYSWLALVGHDLVVMAVTVGLDNLAGAMGATVFGAFLMALCDARFSAFQFATLSALSAAARSFVGPAAAYLIGQIGWASFFVVTFAAAIPGLLLLVMLRARIMALDSTL